MLLALTGGFAVGAWRPDRVAAGLAPVAVLAAAGASYLSTAEVLAARSHPIDELAHLPFLLGAAGAVLAARTPPRRVPPRGEGRSPGVGGSAAVP
jgi:hypothetical protein